VRRIEAVTAAVGRIVQALEFVSCTMQPPCSRPPAAEISQKITQVQDTVKTLEKELARLKSKSRRCQGE